MSRQRELGQRGLICAELTRDERDAVELMKRTLLVATDADLVRLALDNQCTVSQIPVPTSCFRLVRRHRRSA